jgi:hypothetical protein
MQWVKYGACVFLESTCPADHVIDV